MKSLFCFSRADALMTDPVQEPSADSMNTADLATFSATDDQSAADSARDENATDRAMRSVRCFMRVILVNENRPICCAAPAFVDQKQCLSWLFEVGFDGEG